MRAQGLLSPHRGRQGEPKPSRRHDCHLGARRHVGYRWRAGVDRRRRLGLDLRGHRPLECRVCGMARVQGGRPFRRPLEPVAQGLLAPQRHRSRRTRRAACRSGWTTAASICRTTSSTQVRYWGIRPSFGLLKEPETNGVVERWNRTLKEQANLRPGLSKSRRRARRRRRVRRALQPVLAPRDSSPIARHSRPSEEYELRQAA